MIETLFYKCYYSYLMGNQEDTTMFYEMLKEEFRISGSSESLNQYQFQYLAEVKRALDGGSTSSRDWLTETVPAAAQGQTEHDINQKELVKKIHFEGFDQLKNHLGADKHFYLYNIEHPCTPYGIVDMYYMDGVTAYPLEVKKDQGDHKLLGQILKYDLYCRLHLHEKLYQRVQSVTLCNSYDPFTLTELKRHGIIILLYSDIGQISLSRL